MGGFRLDTSGAVVPISAHGEPMPHLGTIWPDLSPFEQGYVEALFASLDVDFIAHWLDHVDPYRTPGFSDLAPEALAAIRKDCAAFQARYAKATTWNSGAQFWRDRSRSFYGVAGNRGRPAFSPLTITLGDDGNVRTSTRGGA